MCAVDLKTTARVSEQKDGFNLKTSGSLDSEIRLLKDQIGKYSHRVLDYTNASIKVVSDLGIKATPISIEITSNLPAKAGLSSSAAVSVASIAAVASFYGLNLSIDKVCNLAYKVEAEELKTDAGQMDLYSSGIGGLIYLDSSTIPPSNIEKFILPNGFDIVIADTCTPRNTADVIREKRKRFNKKDPSIMKYIETTNEAIQQLRSLLNSSSPDINHIGQMISHCHTLLRDYMGVSTNLIEDCIKTFFKNGALGAKLTGTGMGGCAFAVIDKAKTPKLLRSLSELPVKVYVTKQSENGVVITKI